MKIAVVLYLCLGVVLSGRHRGRRCNSLIANLERDRDRVVKRCSFDVDCGRPKDLENAAVSYTCTYFDSVATYRCNEGFSFIGYTQDVVCGVFQKWSDILGTCVVDCGIPPDVEGATVCYRATTPGAVATYTCLDSAAVIVGSNQATCGETGTWTPVVTSCVIDCGNPPDVTGAQVVNNATTPGAVATYTCVDSDAVIVGSNQATCGETGTWTPVVTSCVIDCGNPPDVTGAQVVNNATTPGAVATYTCVDSDAVIVGSNQATCGETGTWTPVVTSCVMPIPCYDPPSVTCADIEVVSTSPSEAVATYPCVPGYGREGPDQAVCSATGMWTPVVAPCVCLKLTGQFVKFPGKATPGLNYQEIKNISLDECKRRCLEVEAILCKSVSYADNFGFRSCFLSENARCDVGDGFVDSPFLDFYERACGE